jgi:hypothetical protein
MVCVTGFWLRWRMLKWLDLVGAQGGPGCERAVCFWDRAEVLVHGKVCRVPPRRRAQARLLIGCERDKILHCWALIRRVGLANHERSRSPAATRLALLPEAPPSVPAKIISRRSAPAGVAPARGSPPTRPLLPASGHKNLTPHPLPSPKAPLSTTTLTSAVACLLRDIQRFSRYFLLRCVGATSHSFRAED